MSELVRWFEEAGFETVSTYKASGNVIFDSPRPTVSEVRPMVETLVRDHLGGDVKVLVRRTADLLAIVARSPFRRVDFSGGTRYVTFLPDGGAPAGRLPPRSPGGDVELVEMVGDEVFTVGRRVGSLLGFPNGFIEEALGIPTTTRNWSAVEGIAQAIAGRGRATTPAPNPRRLRRTAQNTSRE
jgi:uncharacterized protein (DUF1697 family)